MVQQPVMKKKFKPAVLSLIFDLCHLLSVTEESRRLGLGVCHLNEVKFGGFRSQLRAFRVSRHTEELCDGGVWQTTLYACMHAHKLLLLLLLQLQLLIMIWRRNVCRRKFIGRRLTIDIALLNISRISYKKRNKVIALLKPYSIQLNGGQIKVKLLKYL